MSYESEKYRKEKERLKGTLTQMLHDEEAAGWVVDRDIGKAEVLRERFPDRCLSLVSFDVDRIKDFVFATTKPLEVQGASAIVSECTDRKGIEKILKAEGYDERGILFAGGGTGLLMVPAHKEKKIADNIRRQFGEETHTGSCTVVCRAFAPHELILGPDLSSVDVSQLPKGISLIQGDSGKPIRFGEVFKLLSDQLRETKEEKLSLPFPSLTGIFHRCESCGKEVATQLDRVARDEPRERICETCLCKRNRGRKEQGELKKTPELQTARTINKIAGVEEQRYFAVLYADANNMGRALFRMETMADYALFSQAVSRTMDQVRRDIVRNHNLKGCYQAPVIGGDDIVFMLPAGKVAGIVLDLMKGVKECFSQEADAIGGKVAEILRGIGMSVGFVIVPAHFAIRFAVDYAEFLLRSAKEKRAALKQDCKEEDCIDYLVIKDASPLNLSISTLRNLYFQRRSRGQWTLKLTRKPVTLSDFRGMLEDIKLLQEARVAQIQLRQVKTLLTQEPPKAAKLNIGYQWLQTESWKKFCEDKGCGTNVVRGLEESGVLIEDGTRYKTGFLDLLELYEFKEEG